MNFEPFVRPPRSKGRKPDPAPTFSLYGSPPCYLRINAAAGRLIGLSGGEAVVFIADRDAVLFGVKLADEGRDSYRLRKAGHLAFRVGCTAFCKWAGIAEPGRFRVVRLRGESVRALVANWREPLP